MVELHIAKLGAVESKERSDAVELRDVKERLFIADEGNNAARGDRT